MKNRMLCFLLATTFIILGGISSIGIINTGQRAEAQLTPDYGSRRVINYFVVGEEPLPMGEDVYRTKWRWAPKLLAVYLDGKRCRENIDYTLYPRSKQISFRSGTVGKPVVVDYHPRSR